MASQIKCNVKLATLAVFTTSLSVGAFAKTADPSETASTTIGIYQTMLGSVAIMSNQFPRLQELRVSLADDCRKKSENDISIKNTTNYCYCAAVVTTAIWMRYPDKNIQSKLVEVMDKGSGKPSELLIFSSPDQYSSICKAVDNDLDKQSTFKPSEK